MSSYKILLLGDFHYGESYRGAGAKILASHGYEYATEYLRPFVEEADTVVVNLETPLVDPLETPSPFEGTKPYVHWGDPENTVRALKELKVGAAGLANNHALDHGVEGLYETLDALKKGGIQAFGAGRDRREASRPVTIALPDGLGGGQVDIYTAFRWRRHYDRDFAFYARRRKPGAMSLSPRSAKRMRPTDRAAFNVFYPHWGADYRWALNQQRVVADILTGNGFDLVVGHGSHCLQEYEMVNGVPVVYGIGNGVFQSRGRYRAHVEKSEILPYGFWAMLHISRRDADWQGFLRLYPVYSDNRQTAFQPRPVNRGDFDNLLRQLEPVTHSFENEGGNLVTGEDSLGYYISVGLIDQPKDSPTYRVREANGSWGTERGSLLQVTDRVRQTRGLDGRPVPLEGAAYRPRDLGPGKVFFPDTQNWTLRYKTYHRKHGLDDTGIRTAVAERGAAAVVTERGNLECGSPIIQVDSSRQALWDFAVQARDDFDGDVAGITGTVGKTSTKDLLAHVLADRGAVVRTPGSENTYEGVALTLSRLVTQPTAAVVEAAISSFARRWPNYHTGSLIKPTLAIITAVGKAHLDVAPTLSDAVEIKGRLIEGLERNGVVILGDDIPHIDVLKRKAITAGASAIFTVGKDDKSDGRLVSWKPVEGGAAVEANVFGVPYSYTLTSPGLGLALNSVTVLVAAQTLGLDMERTVASLSTFNAAGRNMAEITKVQVTGGEATLIDDTRNAADLSVLAALQLAENLERGTSGRLIVGLGHIVNLGDQAETIQAAFAGPIRKSGADLVVTTGKGMEQLRANLDGDMVGLHADNPEEMAREIHSLLRDGDVVLLKGSHRNTGFRGVPRMIRELSKTSKRETQ